MNSKACCFKVILFLLLVSPQLTLLANDPGKNDNPPAYTAFIVSGKVVDNKGNALAGASILQKGTNNATTSGADGSFSITIQGDAAVLVVSFVGYLNKEVSVTSEATNLVIDLTPGISSLEDVIVVGYGTQKRQLTTASVSNVKGEQLAAVPAANISNSLAGRATGIISRANGGRPGADNSTVYIRGISTTGNNAPLIVVDGVIRNNINEVDPNNIESVSILKDAAAVAPYGLGGANGVILITTKRGSSGAPVFSVGGYWGDQQPTYVPKC
jgi:Outer membrane cobalamin receptor protein